MPANPPPRPRDDGTGRYEQDSDRFVPVDNGSAQNPYPTDRPAPGPPPGSPAGPAGFLGSPAGSGRFGAQPGGQPGSLGGPGRPDRFGDTGPTSDVDWFGTGHPAPAPEPPYRAGAGDEPVSDPFADLRARLAPPDRYPPESQRPDGPGRYPPGQDRYGPSGDRHPPEPGRYQSEPRPGPDWYAPEQPGPRPTPPYPDSVERDDNSTQWGYGPAPSPRPADPPGYGRGAAADPDATGWLPVDQGAGSGSDWFTPPARAGQDDPAGGTAPAGPGYDMPLGGAGRDVPGGTPRDTRSGPPGALPGGSMAPNPPGGAGFNAPAQPGALPYDLPGAGPDARGAGFHASDGGVPYDLRGGPDQRDAARNTPAGAHDAPGGAHDDSTVHDLPAVGFGGAGPDAPGDAGHSGAGHGGGYSGAGSDIPSGGHEPGGAGPAGWAAGGDRAAPGRAGYAEGTDPLAPVPADRLAAAVNAGVAVVLFGAVIAAGWLDRPAGLGACAVLQVVLVLAWVFGTRRPGPAVVGVVALGAGFVADGLAGYGAAVSLGQLGYVLAGGLLAAAAGQLARGAGRARVTDSLASAMFAVTGTVAVPAVVVLSRLAEGRSAVLPLLGAAGAGVVLARLVDVVWHKPRASAPVARGIVGVVVGGVVAATAVGFVLGQRAGLSGPHAAVAGLVMGLAAVLADVGISFGGSGRELSGEPPHRWPARFVLGPAVAAAFAAPVAYVLGWLVLLPPQ